MGLDGVRKSHRVDEGRIRPLQRTLLVLTGQWGTRDGRRPAVETGPHTLSPSSSTIPATETPDVFLPRGRVLPHAQRFR